MSTKNKKTSPDYLKTLETVKKEYEEYLKVSKIYELPIFQNKMPVQYQPPSIENPLTTNTFKIK